MKKRIYFDWEKGRKTPFWIHGASPDYTEGEEGVDTIAESVVPGTLYVIVKYKTGEFIEIVGIPFIITQISFYGPDKRNHY